MQPRRRSEASPADSVRPRGHALPKDYCVDVLLSWRVTAMRFAAGILLCYSSWTAWGADTTSPVADAAEKNDQVRVFALIQAGADVNAAQVDGMTALHWTAYLDDIDAARQLIQAGAHVRAENRYGVTPLSLACQNGNGKFVELLLQAGANPNAVLRGGETALMTAARTGRVGPVKALLARGAEVNAKERKGQTALMWASAEGQAEVVDLLLQAGGDFKEPLPDSGFTPLFFAVREGHAEVVRRLLQAGAEVNGTLQPKKSFGRAPRKGTSPLLLAVENGHFELAVALLEAGADPNDQRSGFTALHALTWVRKPNRGDGEDGDPPPTGSGRLNSLQMVRALVEHGADVNARLERGRAGKAQLNRRGATPLLLAAATADAPLMRLLVELGADPTVGNIDHCMPLMAAAGIGCMAPTEEAGTEPEVLEAVALALKWGNDVNAVDDNGETAMHGAAYKNLPQVVRFLAEKGAKVDVWNRTNHYGWTPLSIAEGYRVGNFKPSPETVAALHEVMRAAGLTPPASAAPVAEQKPEAYPAEGVKKDGI